jgi:hypothetical protein
MAGRRNDLAKYLLDVESIRVGRQYSEDDISEESDSDLDGFVVADSYEEGEGEGEGEGEDSTDTGSASGDTTMEVAAVGDEAGSVEMVEADREEEEADSKTREEGTSGDDTDPDPVPVRVRRRRVEGVSRLRSVGGETPSIQCSRGRGRSGTSVKSGGSRQSLQREGCSSGCRAAVVVARALGQFRREVRELQEQLDIVEYYVELGLLVGSVDSGRTVVKRDGVDKRRRRRRSFSK